MSFLSPNQQPQSSDGIILNSQRKVSIYQQYDSKNVPSVWYGIVEFKIIPSLLWGCWLGDRKDIRPVKRYYYAAAGCDLTSVTLCSQDTARPDTMVLVGRLSAHLRCKLQTTIVRHVYIFRATDQNSSGWQIILLFVAGRLYIWNSLPADQSWSWVTFSKPNPKFLDPTQPTKVFTRPNPTHHRHLVWHIRL